MSVKRFAAIPFGECEPDSSTSFEERPDGPLVWYSDHAAAMAEKDAVVARQAEAIRAVVNSYTMEGRPFTENWKSAWYRLLVVNGEVQPIAAALAWLEEQRREAGRRVLESVRADIDTLGTIVGLAGIDVEHLQGSLAEAIVAWLESQKRQAIREGRQWAIDLLEAWGEEESGAERFYRTVAEELREALERIESEEP